MSNPESRGFLSLLDGRRSRPWTALQKTILSLVFIALGTASLGVTLIRWVEWRSKPGPVPIAAPMKAEIDLEALLQTAFSEHPHQVGNGKILALYLLHTDGCLLCVNDLADYIGLLGGEAGTGKVSQALLWVGDDQAEADRLSAILNLDIPFGFIDSSQVPDGLQMGLGRAQSAAFILPAENLVFYRILLTTAGTSLSRKQAYLAKMSEAGHALIAGLFVSQTPIKRRVSHEMERKD